MNDYQSAQSDYLLLPVSLHPVILVPCLWYVSFPVEIMCGNPPLIESADRVWNNNSAPGSTVLYYCKEGFYNMGGMNLSVCNENGFWTPATLSCRGKPL